MKSFIQCFLLALLIISGTQASAQTQVVDLSTGIFPDNTATMMPAGSNDDTWTVSYNNPNGTYQPVPCGGMGIYACSSPNVQWLTPYYNSEGPGGYYYFKMKFNVDLCQITAASLDFQLIGADDAVDQIIVNNVPHNSLNYSYLYWCTTPNAVSIPVTGEVYPGQNEIIVRVKNWSNSSIPVTPIGLMIDGKLNLWGTPNPASSFSLTSSGGNVQATSTFSGNQTWTVYGSQTGNQGSYSYINTYSNVSSINFPATMPCYLIQHTSTDNCGSSCTAQSICNLACESQCNITAPDNLHLSYEGMTWPPTANGPYKFSWNPVSGAVSYVLEIVWNDPVCCNNGQTGVSFDIPLTTTSHQMNLYIDCFSWRVRAVCADGSSVVSGKKCENIGSTGGGGGPQGKPGNGATDKGSNLIKIFPNPAHESVSFDVETAGDVSFTIDVTDINGRTVKAFAPAKTNAGKATIKWSTASVSGGVYLVKITTGDNQVVTQKLVIE